MATFHDLDHDHDLALDLPASLRDVAIRPDDRRYPGVRSTYIRGGAPALVLQPRTTAEVVDALGHARSQPGPLSIRSGGHGISGRSTNRGGTVIDLSRLDGIEVLDAATRRVRIGPGARWAEVAAALAPHGWAITSGDYGGTGVGGLATAAGIGWLARSHGLTIDHVRAVEMVLADGRVVRASDDENADLFWAVRGAGANFGIVTAFEMEADPVDEVGFAQLIVDASDTATFLSRWGEAVAAAPRDLTSFLTAWRAGPDLVVARVIGVVDTTDPRIVDERVAPLFDVAPVLGRSVQVVPYAATVHDPHAPHDAVGEPTIHSAFVDAITPALAAGVDGLLRRGDASIVQVRSVGGAVADVAPDATAYAHRSAGFHLIATGDDPARLDPAWDALRGHFQGLYLSFETDQRPERLLDAFPPATLDRLRELKARYDPDNVFRDNFNITPAGSGSSSGVAASSERAA